MKNRLLTIIILTVCALSLCGCAKKCANCGNEIEEDKEVVIENSTYCENCIERCASCSTPFVIDSDELQEIEGKKYCKDCTINCAACGEPYAKGSDKVYKIDDNYYCVNCVDRCESCDTAFTKGSDELQEIDGKKYCKNCIAYCASCNSVFVKGSEELHAIGGILYCDNCVEYCDSCNSIHPKNNKALLKYEGKKYCSECFKKAAYPIVLTDSDIVTISITDYENATGTFTVSMTNKTDYHISVFQDGDTVLDGQKQCLSDTDGWSSFAYADVLPNDTRIVFSTFRESTDKYENILKMSDNHTFAFMMTAYIDDENFDDFKDITFKVQLTPDMFGYSQ